MHHVLLAAVQWHLKSQVIIPIFLLQYPSFHFKTELVPGEYKGEIPAKFDKRDFSIIEKMSFFFLIKTHKGKVVIRLH